MAIENTLVEIVSTGQEFNVPGDWTREQIVSSFGASVTGIGSMESSEATEGTTKRVTFRPRSGTKG